MVGFFSYVTCHPLFVQYTAAGDPDCVVGYSTGLIDVGADHGSVQLESTNNIETITSDDRIIMKKGNKKLC